jgi:hypothetical protein
MLGSLQWALRQSKEHRNRWWVGGVLFAILVTIALLLIPRSWATQLEIAPMAIAMAVIAVLLLSLLYALALAPYEQRGDLRKKVSALEADLEKRNAEPLDDEHLQRVKRIAASVRASINRGLRSEYRDPNASGNQLDPRFRKCLRAHCPDLVDPLDNWDAFLETRAKAQNQLASLVNEQVAQRFEHPPWIPVSLARAVSQSIIQGDYEISIKPAEDTDYLDYWVEDPRSLMPPGRQGERIRVRLGTDVNTTTQELQEFLDELLKSSAISRLNGTLVLGRLKMDVVWAAARDALNDLMNMDSLPRGADCPLLGK